MFLSGSLWWFCAVTRRLRCGSHSEKRSSKDLYFWTSFLETWLYPLVPLELEVKLRRPWKWNAAFKPPKSWRWFCLVCFYHTWLIPWWLIPWAIRCAFVAPARSCRGPCYQPPRHSARLGLILNTTSKISGLTLEVLPLCICLLRVWWDIIFFLFLGKQQFRYISLVVLLPDISICLNLLLNWKTIPLSETWKEREKLASW